jgi:uncharacterized protein (TIGR01777 family)
MIVDRRTTVPHSAEDVFQWHARPGAFERLVPPWEDVRLRAGHPGLEPDSLVELEVRSGWRTTRWVGRHTDVRPGRGFTDVQVRGPFASWRHRHDFEPVDDRTSVLADRIQAELPLGPLGELALPAVRRRIRRALRYRHDVTAADLELHRTWSEAPRRTIAISGASGFIGRTVRAMLTTGGHRVIPLVRRQPRADEIGWDPAGRLDPAALAEVDAVLHLAGESIGDHRWTAERRRHILDSRVRGTTTVVDAMIAAPARPRTLVTASAIGFYGDRGDELLTEEAAQGRGFLAEVVTAWEAAAARARPAGIRVVHPRFGIVLSPAGGALAQMLLPFRFGLGGPLGSGRQWMSWVSLDDTAGVLIHALFTDSLNGPVNTVGPEPVTNAVFARTLGRVLGRPAVVPVPRAALRLALDGFADEGVLASARVVAARLTESGYRFRHSTLEAALRHELGRQVGP